jgi:hypothetical protein
MFDAISSEINNGNETEFPQVYAKKKLRRRIKAVREAADTVMAIKVGSNKWPIWV